MERRGVAGIKRENLSTKVTRMLRVEKKRLVELAGIEPATS